MLKDYPNFTHQSSTVKESDGELSVLYAQLDVFQGLRLAKPDILDAIRSADNGDIEPLMEFSCS